MLEGKRVAVIIPAFNEEQAIAKVIQALPRSMDQILVCDNNSRDKTAVVAKAAGATVVPAKRQGYGSACLAGLKHLEQTTPPDLILFLDGDFADEPRLAERLLIPIANDQVDLVIGSRRSLAEPGSLTPVQVFGNALACRLIKWIWGADFTDLGPFRAISWAALQKLHMQDPNFGWTVEMQIKATKQKLRFMEFHVPYRPRIGTSKVSGTVSGSAKAGAKILYLIARSLFKRS